MTTAHAAPFIGPLPTGFVEVTHTFRAAHIEPRYVVAPVRDTKTARFVTVGGSKVRFNMDGWATGANRLYYTIRRG